MTLDSSANLLLHLESVPLVDLRFLSQSDLNSLSLCSNEAFDVGRCDDVVIPKIDRSLFNESAGSRKQTYSRLRLAPRKPEVTTSSIGRGRPCASLVSVVPRPSSNPIDDPERNENKLIAALLRDLLARGNSAPVDHLEKSVSSSDVQNGEGAATRKRCREKEGELYPNPSNLTLQAKGYGFHAANVAMEIVNKNSVVVNIDALASLEDPYGPELKRRTVGLETEEELLVFLRGLEGQWGSRRRRRKIVDASMFGDALPIGWKLLLSLKRKEGRVWLYCRRYISPSGRQFLSLREVSSYLLSIFGPKNESPPGDKNHCSAYELAAASIAGLTVKDDGKREDLLYHPASTVPFLSTEQEKEVDLFGSENLADVEIIDLLECHICKMNFNEKDAYLQHLLSSHQRSAKRCRLGSSVGDGVIIKDGKYECQFCHKIFLERHRYNGHVGVHVRNYVRSLEASQAGIAMKKNVDLSSLRGVDVSEINASINVEEVSVALPSANTSDKMSTGSPNVELDKNSIPEISTKFSMHGKQDTGDFLSKKDTGDSVPQTSAEHKDELIRVPSTLYNASVDIHNISIVQAPSAKPKDKIDSCFPNGELDTNSIVETSTAKFNNELSVGSVDSKQDYANSIPQTSVQSNDEFGMLPLGLSGTNNYLLPSSGVDDTFSISKRDFEPDKVKASENNEPENDLCSGQGTCYKEILAENLGDVNEENILLQGMVSDMSSSLVQSSDCFPAFKMISDKEQVANNFCNVNEKNENESCFGEMRLDDVEPASFDLGTTAQGSSAEPEVPIDSAYSADLEQGLADTSVPFEWEPILLTKMDTSHQVTTVCIWCRTSYNHESINLEKQSDSDSFICPACKARISGQLNIQDHGLSMSLDHL